jgi:hypothetical protein
MPRRRAPQNAGASQGGATPTPGAVAGPMWRPLNAGVRAGTMSSNLLCSSGESRANRAILGRGPALSILPAASVSPWHRLEISAVAGRPFFVPSPAIRFPERAEGVKGPKRQHSLAACRLAALVFRSALPPEHAEGG